MIFAKQEEQIVLVFTDFPVIIADLLRRVEIIIIPFAEVFCNGCRRPP